MTWPKRKSKNQNPALVRRAVPVAPGPQFKEFLNQAVAANPNSEEEKEAFKNMENRLKDLQGIVRVFIAKNNENLLNQLLKQYGNSSGYIRGLLVNGIPTSYTKPVLAKILKDMQDIGT